jgi:preprotein translocase subunit SecB
MTKLSSEFKSKLRFSNYVVNEIQFNRNEHIDKGESVPISFSMEKDIKFDTENNTADVTLDVKIFENAKENNYPFYFKLQLTGFFQVDNIQTKQERNLIETNAIAILFPYIRALVSSYTANANVRPLILPPINVVKYMQDNTEDTKKTE